MDALGGGGGYLFHALGIQGDAGAAKALVDAPVIQLADARRRCGREGAGRFGAGNDQSVSRRHQQQPAAGAHAAAQQPLQKAVSSQDVHGTVKEIPAIVGDIPNG